MRKLTHEEIKILAECERKMDAGKTPHVVVDGHRFAVNDEILEHFGLQNRQTVTNVIITAILEFNIERLKKEIMDEEAKKIKNAKPEDFESTTML